MNRLFFFFITFFFAVTTAFSQPLSKDAEQRLLSFCELYSTVKYYYPEPNLQDFPWDAFAYQGYKIAATAKNDKEFIKKINEFFHIIAPGVQISKKEFDIAHITPKDTSLYSGKAFWQHRGGLNVGHPSFSDATTTLNYIYKKPVGTYQMYQRIAAESKGLLGKKLRISLLAKVEDNSDSIKVFSFNTTDVERKGAKIVEIAIWAAGNEWKYYTVEIEHPDSIIFSDLTIYHPTKGTVYLDDLKLERFENGKWERIKIDNAGFESYTTSGTLSYWNQMHNTDALVVADSINAVVGKYCLKLPVVQDKLRYAPAPIDQPHIVSLPKGYKAYVPLQLYADEKTVFPLSDKQKIENFTKTLRQDSLTSNQLAIACVMQTWAALYQDYPYREDDFENKLNQLLLHTIHELETTKTVYFYALLVHEFLIWINDPHLGLDEGEKFLSRNPRRAGNIPVKRPKPICLTETQCVVTNVMDSVTNLKVGDVILKVNRLSIDSLLQLYSTHNISRYTQRRVSERFLVRYRAPEINVQLLRNGDTLEVVFSTYKQQKSWSISSLEKENREKCQILQDSLKEATGLFYLNTIYPSEAFSTSIIRYSGERTSNQRHATNSLITELNQYKALILDVRGRPDDSNRILLYLNECMGIDLSRNTNVIKTAFFPVAQFKYDTSRTSVRQRKEMFISVPVYVLIDYNTISASERDLISLKESGRATFIGSNTAGAAGSICKTKITDDIILRYSTGKKVGLDDNPMSYQSVGFAPDIYAYSSPQGIAEGRDEVLEKAIEVALREIEEEEK